MFGIGMPEMILILAIALIVIGPKKLPDLAKSLGKAMGEFKRATSDLKDSLQVDSELKEVKDAFGDMNKELKDSVDLVGSLDDDKKGESDAPQAEALHGEADDKTSPADQDPLSDVKKAFDALNQEDQPEDSVPSEERYPQDLAQKSADEPASPPTTADAEDEKKT